MCGEWSRPLCCCCLGSKAEVVLVDGMAFRIQSMESIYRLLVLESLESRKAVVVFVARKFGYNGRSRKEKNLEMWRARQSY